MHKKWHQISKLRVHFIWLISVCCCIRNSQPPLHPCQTEYTVASFHPKVLLSLSFIYLFIYFCSVFEAGKRLWRSYRRSTLRLMCCFTEPTPSDRNWTVRANTLTHTHTHLTTTTSLWMSTLLYFSLCDSWSLRWPSQLLAREASPGLLQLSTLFTLLQPDPPYSMFPNAAIRFISFLGPLSFPPIPNSLAFPSVSPLSASSVMGLDLSLPLSCPSRPSPLCQ